MDTENNLQQIDKIDFNHEAYKLLDKVLQKANDFDVFYIRSLLNDEFKEFEFNTANKLSMRLHDIIIHYGYVFPCQINIKTSLTPLGMKVKEMGGHAKYLKFLDSKVKAIEVKEKAEYDNLIHSTKVNKYLYRTRWVPHILALGALAVSIWALVESKKEKVPENKTNSEVQIENKK